MKSKGSTWLKLKTIKICKKEVVSVFGREVAKQIDYGTQVVVDIAYQAGTSEFRDDKEGDENG